MVPARCLKSFAPGRASHKAGRALDAVFLWEARPRGEWRQLDVGEASPRGRASHKAGRALDAVSCRRRDPRRRAPARCPKSFAPRSGLLRRRGVRWMLFLVGGATRGEWRQLDVGEASPRVGPPTKRGVCWVPFSVEGAPSRRRVLAQCWKSFAPRSGLLQGGSCAGWCFLWEARPAANDVGSVLEKLRPEVGPPTKRGVCWVVLLVGGATRGEWRQLGARKLRPEGRPPCGLAHRLGHGIDQRL